MHIPVLVKEIIEYLNPEPGKIFIDATVDGGGHAIAILEKILPDGRLLGIDHDGQLLRRLEIKIENSEFKNNTVLVNDSYANLKNISRANNFTEVNGVLFDLGMSSWHIEEAGRGFSFQKDEPLDMRFDDRPGTQTRAVDIVNGYSYDELAEILKEYGEERFAKSIAAGIVRERKSKSILTTFELVEVIKKSVPFFYRRGRIHFATRTFQALRICVNQELENLIVGMGQAAEILGSGGRMAVISFHSLEDRIVKNFFKNKASEGALKIITKKPICAGLGETIENPRSRSAKLRVAEKLPISELSQNASVR